MPESTEADKKLFLRHAASGDKRGFLLAACAEDISKAHISINSS